MLDRAIEREMRDVTTALIGAGICDDQNFPSKRHLQSGVTRIGIGLTADWSVVLKDIYYKDTYLELRKSRLYNILFPDGGMVQLMYDVANGDIVSHRLAFLPSPDLSEYQNFPEIYEEELMFAEVAKKSVVPTPIRFDFDRSNAVPVIHPMSHLTIGQYRFCRIPVSRAVTPQKFLSFIIKSFYNFPGSDFSAALPTTSVVTEECIHEKERALAFVSFP